MDSLLTSSFAVGAVDDDSAVFLFAGLAGAATEGALEFVFAAVAVSFHFSSLL